MWTPSMGFHWRGWSHNPHAFPFPCDFLYFHFYPLFSSPVSTALLPRFSYTPSTRLYYYYLPYFIIIIFFCNSRIWAATFPTIPRSSTPTEGMLNPLWPRLEPGWRTVQLYLLYHQATSAWLLLDCFVASLSFFG